MDQPFLRRPRPAQAPGERNSRQTSPWVVLIADDSRDARDMYGQYLRHRGFRTFTTPDGAAAVELAIELRPDVVVMDLSMPLFDGLTAIKRLKQHPRPRPIPVILLTGYPSLAIERGALEAGADVFLTKPCLPEDLEGHVRRVLESGPNR